jgi:mono/diheme cytochrome c family protein
MSYRILLICLLFALAFSILSQPSQVTAGPGATLTADQDNPVKPTPESLAKAKKLYGYDCAMCHGATGDGKGDLASDFKTKPRDYTDPNSLKDFTDAQLFTIIKDGKGDMPPEAKRAKPDDLWALVNYIRSLSKK